jgi:hypothetical protein
VLKNLGAVAAVLILCACGVPERPEGVPVTYGRDALPEVAEPVDVPIDADVCTLVDADLLGDLDLDASGAGRPGLCEWKSGSGNRMMVGLKVGRNPLLDIVGSPAPELRQVGLHGFPAVYSDAEGRDACDVYVSTGGEQGFAVILKGEQPCDGAVAVAGQVAGKLRG